MTKHSPFFLENKVLAVQDMFDRGAFFHRKKCNFSPCAMFRLYDHLILHRTFKTCYKCRLVWFSFYLFVVVINTYFLNVSTIIRFKSLDIDMKLYLKKQHSSCKYERD